MDFTLEIFWTEYTEFDNKNGLFYGDEFFWKSKDIRDSNSHFQNQKYLLSRTKVLGFAACKITSQILVIGV